MILTNSASLLEHLFQDSAPNIRCYSIIGDYTAQGLATTVEKTGFGVRRSVQMDAIEVQWMTEDNLASAEPFLPISRKLRATFGIPTYTLNELSLIYRFKGKECDPPVIKEVLKMDSTKAHWFGTRRNPDGICKHPNDWIYETQHHFVEAMKADENVPDEVMRRLRDSFLVTDKTEPDIMNDEEIMSSLRLPFMALVFDNVRAYSLRGVQK
jgi:hypothetical protein